MSPSAVNNAARTLMARLREWYEDAQWVDLGHDSIVVSGSGTSLVLTGDVTDYYQVGQMVRIDGTVGIITAVSFSTNTTLTINNVNMVGSPSLIESAIVSSSIARLYGGANYAGYETVDGSFKISGPVIVTGAATFNSTLVANSGINVTGSVSATAGISSGGGAAITGDSQVTGSLIVTVDLSVTDDLTVGDQLTVGGVTNLNGAVNVGGTPLVSSVLPPGLVMDYAGSTAPSGWLLCNGAALATASYPNLFAAIGYTYGGSGGTFYVPDCRGRTRIGVGQGTGLSNRSLGVKSGTETHQLSVAELPSHSHSYSYFATNTSQFDVKFPGPAPIDSTSPTVGASGSAGSNFAHNNMQPFIAMNAIIKV